MPTAMNRMPHQKSLGDRILTVRPFAARSDAALTQA
jgi:hypothetical protein